MARLDVDPKLPQGGDYGLLRARLYDVLGKAFVQINGISEGRGSSVTNASTAAPTTGTWAQGDFVKNSAPTELGVASSKYVINGWICTAGGTPGTWVQCRYLTGN